MQALDTPQLLAIAAALGWASGLRLYLVVFLTGMAGFFGWVELPQGLKLLQHPAMLGASGFMLFVEFFADKIPGLDIYVSSPRSKRSNSFAILVGDIPTPLSLMLIFTLSTTISALISTRPPFGVYLTALDIRLIIIW